MTKPLLVAAALLLGAATPGTAAGPAPTALYLHGPSVAGEVDGVMWIGSLFPPDAPMRMDPTAPTDPQGKSMSYTSVVNDQCTGTPMYPTFQATMAGRIEGSPSLSLHFVGAPGRITARLWVDTPMFSCNLEYVPPAAEVVLDVPAGQSKVDVAFPSVQSKRRTVKRHVTLMVLAPQVPAYSGQVGRLRYDGTATPSSLTLTCKPPKGARSCFR